MVTGDTKLIAGANVVDVRRFGKGLVIDLDNDYSIAIHIKLTGQLIYQGSKISKEGKVPKVSKEKVGTVPNKFTHIVFHLDHNSFLYYNDQRQFGWFKIIQTARLKEQSFFRDLGPEFFRDLTLAKFSDIIQSSKTAIKPLVMDQKKMSGLGNIYANDGFNLARIDPRRKANTLTSEEIKTLFSAFETVLKKGLEVGGASELNYVNALGGEGGYQHHFNTYGREGKKCKNCGGIIEKIKLAGRGTYFCPACQR